MNPPLGTRLALASVIGLGAVFAVVLAPWDAGASSATRGGQAWSPSRTPSTLATDPAAPAVPVAGLGTSPTPTPAALATLAEAPLVTPAGIQLDVTYHSQQGGDWCDPADIEMWLQADGVNVVESDDYWASEDYDVQQRFWNYETLDNDGYTVSQWNASPYAVAVTLDHFGGWTDIGDEPQPTADAAGAVISQSLYDLQQPVIVMVGGGIHYVLITGVQLGAAGSDGPPLSVTFDNPEAFGVGGTPPAGSDGSQTMSWDDFTDWYTANTSHGGVWAGQWVLIAAGIPLIG
jgi:hypothetical protein